MEQGKVSIQRIRNVGSRANDKIEITIETQNYKRVLDISVSPENFALALTGLSCVNCEYKSHIKGE